MANPYKVLNSKVQSQNKLIRANEKSMARATLQLRCACLHRDQNGAISLNPPQGQNAEKSKFTGAPLYMCRECFAKLDLSPVSQKDFDTSMDVINRVVHVGKIRTDVKSEKDRDLANDMASLQFMMNTVLPDIFNTISKNGNKKKKKHGGGDDNNIRVSR